MLELTEEKSKEALQWAVAVVVKPEDYRDTLLNMRRQVYTLCWRNFACPVFMPMLTQGMLGFIKIHSLPFADEHIHGTPPALCYTNTDFHEDVEKRRLLVETAVNTLSIPEDDLGLVAEHVLFDTDVDFVFDMIEKPIPPMLYRRWCICLRSLQRLIPFPEMSQRWNDIHYRLPEIISFDAETIIFQRKKWNDELTKSKNNSKRLASDRHKRQQEQRNRSLRFIKSVLKNTDAYKFLPQIITFIMNEAGIDNIDFRNSDIWKEFSPSEIKSLTLAARDFLIKGKKSSFPRTKYSIYPFIPRAFFLVWAEYQCRLKDLPVEAWEEFSLLLFDCLYLNDNDILRPIFESMSQFAPHIYRAAMLEKIKGDAAGGELHITIKYGDLLDDETCEEIIRFAASKKCSDIQRFWLLNTVHGIAPAVVNDFVSKKFLPLQSDITCLGNCVSILVLKILPDKIHDFVQRLVTSSTKWGKAWITDIVKIDRYGGALTASVFRAAAVNDLVVFYIWLHKNYPTSEFPVHEEAYSPSTVDDIYSFIGNIFKIIKDSCSINALSALRHIFAEFPDENWLKMEIIDVDRNYLRECTPVYTAEEINRIIANSEDAIINSSRDLLRVIYALLEDYQIYLTGKDSPRVDDLWNYDNKGGVSHKNEEHFSNHLKSFLTMRLNGKNIAINREVRLNNGIKGAKGSQTDIWINAFSHNGSKNLTLCIEVKGSWNRETHTAMNKQLIGKYMGAGGAAAGILLVGWFQSQSNPVQNVCKNNRLELETMLMQQEGLAIAAGHLVKSIVIDCQAKY